ncbi:MAG TPA: M1 family metallopeptidase [Thermoplasmata archaeon]|nr:M1 family metallopeptidase [Thermoplasmata archaeon]
MTELHCRSYEIGGGEKAFADETAEEHAPRDRDFKLKHLRLTVRLDDKARSVRGTSEITLAPINAGVRRLTLDAVELQVSRVTVDRKPARFEHRDGQVHIALAKAYRPGADLTVAVSYSGKPRNGIFFVQPTKDRPKKLWQVWTQGEAEDNRYWFPSYEAPNDKMTSEVIATVPERYAVISNGVLVSEKRGAGTRTFHWRQDVPHVNYLVTLVAGDFDVVEETADGVPLRYYVPKGLSRLVKLCFQHTPDMVRFFSRVTGVKYPYADYKQVTVEDFTFGGMENTSLTVLTEFSLHEETARPNFQTEGLLAHELAHQWFGDLVTMKAWPHLWLNEGFASYFGPLWHESKFGADEFQLKMLAEHQAYLEEDAKSYRRPIVSTRYHSAEDMFDAHTYQKGASVLHMIRYVLGDALWWKAIRHYVAKHAQGVVETHDFKVAIEEATGRALDVLFKQWVYGAGHPEFEVTWAYDEKAKTAAVTVRQKQEVKDLTSLFSVPADLEVIWDGGTRRQRFQVDKAEHTFTLACPERPKAILFDPENWILKKLTFEKKKDELLFQLAQARNVVPRIQACEGLAKVLSDSDVVKGLERALSRDASWAVRRATAKALGEIGTGDAKRVLLATGLKTAEGRVRRAAVEALGNFRKDAEVFDALARVLREDRADYVVSGTAATLAKLGEPRAYDVLTKTLGTRATHAHVLDRAVLAGLPEFKEEKAIDFLVPYLGPKHPAIVRETACAALARLGDLFEKRRDEVRKALTPLLREGDFRVRRGAASALAALGDPAAIDDLSKVEQFDPHGMIRRQARRSIKAISEKRTNEAKRSETQKDLEGIRDENRKLQQRLAKVEAQVEGLARGKKK